MQHHTLIFNDDFEKHAEQIYETPQWPENPSVYLSCTSQTDPTVAPKGKENLFVLIPVAPGLNDTDAVRQHYFDFSIQRIEETLGINFKNDIIYRRDYSNRDFATDYYAYKGNAYGLANTLMQTAILKPSMFNKKLKKSVIYWSANNPPRTRRATGNYFRSGSSRSDYKKREEKLTH